MFRNYTKTAFIYAYKIKDAVQIGMDPNIISLGYQVREPMLRYQCDFGKEATAYMLEDFKKAGGVVKILDDDKRLIVRLAKTKIRVPVPPHLIKDWGLTDLID